MVMMNQLENLNYEAAQIILFILFLLSVSWSPVLYPLSASNPPAMTSAIGPLSFFFLECACASVSLEYTIHPFPVSDELYHFPVVFSFLARCLVLSFCSTFSLVLLICVCVL